MLHQRNQEKDLVALDSLAFITLAHTRANQYENLKKELLQAHTAAQYS